MHWKSSNTFLKKRNFRTRFPWFLIIYPREVYSTWEFTYSLSITHLEHLHNGWLALLERDGETGSREVFYGQTCT